MDFFRFKVSDIRKTYAPAIQSLSSAYIKLSRQGDSNLVKGEFSLVDIFISLFRFEWQSEYQELAAGLLHAEINQLSSSSVDRFSLKILQDMIEGGEELTSRTSSPRESRLRSTISHLRDAQSSNVTY